ncbi:MAG: TetR/AcrR family transcriptional regulator [Desulfobacteraceae bacterium]|nr:MAG: TetR/AcrR family transcriptional regulator [Desulfobacteraceae bacterium]
MRGIFLNCLNRGKMAARTVKEDTRTRIIDSAKRLFAEQGFVKTTVMDISRQAGLSEAALYEYFQGKEDLLLAIPQLWVSDLLAGLDEQLFGIKGSINKLRKYLWWNFLRIEQAPLDAKIVYLFLKTNANFLNTEVHANVKKLYFYLIEIFEEGKASGEMRPDLDPYLARDIFVGTMDHIVTRWLLKNMAYSLYDNLEETFRIMVDGFRAVPQPGNGNGQGKERSASEEIPNGAGHNGNGTEILKM